MNKRIKKFFFRTLMIYTILTVGLTVPLVQGICLDTFILCYCNDFMSQCTYNEASALKRFSDVVLLWLVLIKRRAVLALSTDALSIPFHPGSAVNSRFFKIFWYVRPFFFIRWSFEIFFIQTFVNSLWRFWYDFTLLLFVIIT